MSDYQSKTVSESMEETKDRHRRYLRAINNPIRRNILRSIKEGNSRLEAIAESVGLDKKIVDWHLSMLVDGFCVEKRNTEGVDRFVLTQEGLVVDFMDK